MAQDAKKNKSIKGTKTNTKKCSLKEKKDKLLKIKASLTKDYDEYEVKPGKQKYEKGVTTEEGTKKKIAISFVIGLVIGLLIMLIFIPKKVATVSNGEDVIVNIGEKTITANQLYENMKKYYSVNILLDEIDNIILTDLYPETNDMKTEVNSTADYYISSYETYYGYTEEEFLSANGFDSKDEFISYLMLNYRRNLALDDYAKSLVTESAINKYYENSVYGDINTKYITIEGNDDEAKSLAQRILNRLSNGQTFEEVVEHYGDQINHEDLGYISYDNDLDENYVNALLKLQENTYTTEAVEVDSNLMIIFRYDQKEKPSIDDVKENIIETLADDIKSDDDSLYYKALINLRKEAKLKFEDDSFAKEYNKYVDTYNTK